jgi:hypothetical protein
MSPRQQRAFLTDAESSTRLQLRRVEEDIARFRDVDRYSYWMMRGAAITLKARLEWLGEMVRERSLDGEGHQEVSAAPG